MRASVKILIGLLAGNLALVSGPALAASQLAYLVQSGGDFVAPAAQSAKMKTENFLQQAKLAMRENRLKDAESYIRQAEESARTIPANEMPLSYSTQQARRELLSIHTPSKQRPAATKNAGATQNAQSALGLTVGTEQSTAKQKCAMLLRDARRQIAQGDMNIAAKLCQQAASLRVKHVTGDDSPSIVNDLIAGHRLASNLQKEKRPEAKRKIAEHLMRQANGMIQYRDYEIARSLLQQAANIPVEYQAHERTPAQMLKTLATLGSSATIRTQTAVSEEEKARLLEIERAIQRAKTSGSAQAKFVEKETAHNSVLPAFRAGKDGSSVIPASTVDSGDALNEFNRTTEIASALESTEKTATAGLPAVMPLEMGTPPNHEAAPEFSTSPPVRVAALPPATVITAHQHLQNGLRALRSNDRVAALHHFNLAYQGRQELTEDEIGLLEERIPQLQQPQESTLEQLPVPDRAKVDKVALEQQKLFENLTREIYKAKSVVEERTKAKDPRGALHYLSGLRRQISDAQLNQVKKKQLLTIVDRSIASQQRYIEINISEIENDEINKARKGEVEGDRARKQAVELQIQRLVEDFNNLTEEHRYAEAEMVARQAYELAPEIDVVQAVHWKARFIRRLRAAEAAKEYKEEAFVNALNEVDDLGGPGSIPSRNREMLYSENWKEKSERRRRLLEENANESVENIRLRKILHSRQVQAVFDNMSLGEVRNILSEQVGVNIYLDERAMAEQGITRDTPVSINLNQPVSLHSALNLILQAHNLAYMVKDDVIQITSKGQRDRNTVKRTYYVADLVIPIPDFTPSNNMGLSAAIGSSLQHAASVASNNGNPNAAGYQTPMLTSASVPQGGNVLAQALPGARNTVPGLGGGPGGAMGGMGRGQGGFGGGAVADFEPLLDLIQDTIAPETWVDMGGTGTVSEFRTNLSIIVSNTQEVHDQIQQLLEQLRRLQDLQITIEVRFITLSDNFFERIGIDFDFNIEDSSTLDPTQPLPDKPAGNQFFGLSAPGTPSPTLDFGFNADSFTSAIPTFGGFDVGTAANFGFAILSDIEVFLLIQASKGDTRTNIMQSPKVTLFNGQTAQVSDQVSRPFVTSVIPVVGDFAAAHQPVITVLAEGTSLTVNAVASSDRRFVRLTLIPFFSQITDVEEFTFTGSETTQTGTSVFDPTDPTGGFFNDNEERTVAGTTLQLPVFATTSVTTTVNVPDGGTVLLGGVKRLSEGRNERGMPFLSNIPYVSRLFKNVGIGRTSQSLMLMVTPRIIIQEEEEERQFGGAGS